MLKSHGTSSLAAEDPLSWICCRSALQRDPERSELVCCERKARACFFPSHLCKKVLGTTIMPYQPI